MKSKLKRKLIQNKLEWEYDEYHDGYFVFDSEHIGFGETLQEALSNYEDDRDGIKY